MMLNNLRINQSLIFVPYILPGPVYRASVDSIKWIVQTWKHSPVSSQFPKFAWRVSKV